MSQLANDANGRQAAGLPSSTPARCWQARRPITRPIWLAGKRKQGAERERERESARVRLAWLNGVH